VLADSRFGPIDALVLRRVRDGYLLYGQEDSFPRPRTIAVLFGRSLLPPTLWATRDFGGDRLFVRKSRA
jgi:hypothetical protein